MIRGEQSIHSILVHKQHKTVRRLQVFCPVQRGTVALDTCTSCPRAHGWALLDPSGEKNGENQGCILCLPQTENGPEAHPGTVAAITRRNLQAVHPGLPARALMEVFSRQEKHGPLPVVDDAGHLVGEVSILDLNRALASGARFEGLPADPALAGGPLRVGDLMRAPYLVCDETDRVERAAQRARETDAPQFWVVDHARRLVGTATALDVLLAEARVVGDSVAGAQGGGRDPLAEAASAG
jgi:CBS domain-containing protein